MDLNRTAKCHRVEVVIMLMAVRIIYSYSDWDMGNVCKLLKADVAINNSTIIECDAISKTCGDKPHETNDGL